MTSEDQATPTARAGDGASWTGRVLLVLLALFVGLASIHDRPLSRRDETRVAGIARAVVLDGDVVTPRLNGEPFLEYPSLGYLPTAAVLELTGRATAYRAKLASILTGMVTVLLTFLLGRVLGGERTGLVAAAVLQTTVGFTNLNGRVLVDPALVMWITSSLYGFAAGYHAERRSFLGFSLFYLGMAGGLLTKGLIGAGLPAATAGVFLLCRRDWRAIRRLRPWWGILLFAAPVLAWGYLLYRQEGAARLEEVLRQSVWRFFSSSADHAAPAWFYVPVMLGVLLPWMLHFPLVFWRHFAPRRLNRGLPLDPRGLFPRVWFATVFLALSAASAKRNLYLAPIYPAFALLVAQWWDAAARRGELPRLDRLFRDAVVPLGLIAVVAAAGIAWVEGGWPAGLGFGAVAAVAIAVTIRFRARLARPGHGLAFYVAALAVAIASGHQYVEIADARRESMDRIFVTLRRVRADRPVVLYRPGESVRGAAVFFLGQRCPVAADVETLEPRIRAAGSALVIAAGRLRLDLERALGPERIVVLDHVFEGRRRLELLEIRGSPGALPGAQR